MFRRTFLLTWLTTTLACADSGSLLSSHASAHLDRALDCLALERAELNFRKDVGKPLASVPRVRELLSDADALPVFGHEVRSTVMSTGSSNVWLQGAAWLGATPRGMKVSPPPPPVWPSNLDPALGVALRLLWEELAVAIVHRDMSVQNIAPTQLVYALSARVGDIFDSEGVPAVRAELRVQGVTEPALAEALRDELNIDPEPGARRFLDALEHFDLSASAAAARALQQVASDCARRLDVVQNWPSRVLRIPTSAGDIYVGTAGPDRYSADALAILDPAGADRYTAPAATANGLRGRPVALVVDLAGDDVYGGDAMLAAGGAWGASVHILDCAGDDTYQTRYDGVASAFFGTACIDDRGGDDSYRGTAHTQGAATVGFAILDDHAGVDTYTGGIYAQGFAGPFGLGVLVDRKGSDRYSAGGLRGHAGRESSRFLSMSQGFSTGLRPLIGGGIGVLADQSGNDVYVGDLFAQASSYWYGAGFLFDGRGHDVYSAHQYSQGSGIHLAAALLWDGAGNDRYTGWDICQGCSHDYSVSFLLDDAGDDTYTANDSSQGMGLHNALGVLVDSAGRDAYFGRRSWTCQGVGHGGGQRDYGCLGLLLDLGGTDHYSSGAIDGARLIRPLYGIVYDLEDAP